MVRDRDLEHPDITAAERTGYPFGYVEPPMAECRECGRALYYSIWNDDYFRLVCRVCGERMWEE